MFFSLFSMGIGGCEKNDLGSEHRPASLPTEASLHDDPLTRTGARTRSPGLVGDFALYSLNAPVRKAFLGQKHTRPDRGPQHRRPCGREGRRVRCGIP